MKNMTDVQKIATGFAFIIILGSGIVFAQGEETANSQDLVLVEPPNYLYSVMTEARIPYQERRSSWGGNFSISSLDFNPVNFSSALVDPASKNFKTKYGSAEQPFINIQLGLQKNFDSFSLSANTSSFFYQNQTDKKLATVDTFTVQGTELSLTLAFDGFSKEPNYVPYITGGLYQIGYKETEAVSGGASATITHLRYTKMAPFYALGIKGQLNGLDAEAASNSYQDFGLENTFLFVEAKSYLESDDDAADLSTSMGIAAGLSFEY